MSLGITLGKITGLTYSNVMSNGEEGGAYFCDLDLAAGSPHLEWIRADGKIRVIDKDPEEESFAEIETLPGGGYKVSLGNVSSYHCGFGSEFPAYIILKKSDKACVVKGRE